VRQVIAETSRVKSLLLEITGWEGEPRHCSVFEPSLGLPAPLGEAARYSAGTSTRRRASSHRIKFAPTFCPGISMKR
jgi:hypothetical protein